MCHVQPLFSVLSKVGRRVSSWLCERYRLLVSQKVPASALNCAQIPPDAGLERLKTRMQTPAISTRWISLRKCILLIGPHLLISSIRNLDFLPPPTLFSVTWGGGLWGQKFRFWASLGACKSRRCVELVPYCSVDKTPRG